MVPQPIKQKSPWLTVPELAEYLKVSAGTIRNWVSMRYVPFIKRGHVIRFHLEKIEEWLRANECEGRTTIANLDLVKKVIGGNK